METKPIHGKPKPEGKQNGQEISGGMGMHLPIPGHVHSNTRRAQFCKRAVHTDCFITAKYRLRARSDER